MEGVLSFKIFVFKFLFSHEIILCVQCVFYIHSNFYCLSSLRDLQVQHT